MYTMFAVCDYSLPAQHCSEQSR